MQIIIPLCKKEKLELVNTKALFKGSINQYSTKLLALRAMRNEIELRYGLSLRKIDLMIEAELSK